MISGINRQGSHPFEPGPDEIYCQYITPYADVPGEKSPVAGEPEFDWPECRNTVLVNWDPHSS